ncbi:MAG: hypothetical protein ABIZ72_06785, partial [Candidatus Limnocylindrales bacterium]
VRYGGRHTADTVLVTLVEDVAMAAGAPAGGGSLATESILVVTDDRALRFAIQHRGARTAGASWLVARMARNRLSAPSIGNSRAQVPPRLRQPAPGSIEEVAADDGGGRAWSPGRGATTKKGNGKRAPKR